MEKVKESFIFYKSYYKAILSLSNKYQLELLKAIIEMSLESKETEIKNEHVNAMFELIKPQITANHRRYKNSLKGGRTKTESMDIRKTETEPTVLKNGIKKKTETKPNENENVNVNENVNPNENINKNHNVNENHNHNENENAGEIRNEIQYMDFFGLSPGEKSEMLRKEISNCGLSDMMKKCLSKWLRHMNHTCHIEDFKETVDKIKQKIPLYTENTIITLIERCIDEGFPEIKWEQAFDYKKIFSYRERKEKEELLNERETDDEEQ